MSGPIRITPEDLADPRVDEEVARQRSFGLAVRGHDERPTPLYMRPWFALMLAGSIGSFAAWAITEPFMDDGVRIRGRVESIEAAGDAGATGAQFPMVAVIGGLRVLVSRHAVVLDENRKKTGIETIQKGDAVELLADVAELPDGSFIVASGFLSRVDPAEVADAPVDLARLRNLDMLVSLLIFPLMAGLIGMLIGATDGLLSRAWARAALTSSVGLGVGILGGLLASFLAGMLYTTGRHLVYSIDTSESETLTGVALLVQIMSRGLAWTTLGLFAGLGQGIAMRSKKLLLNGLIGGIIGGLLGGVLFDPIDLALKDVLVTGGAETSRLVGYVVIGAAIGLMIGLVEFATREAWVRMLTGPIAGKEFVLYRNPTWVGSSPKCEIYLFKDEQVAPRHACIRRTGDAWEIDDQGAAAGTILSGQKIGRSRLRDGDRLRIGRTSMEFRLRDE